MIVDEVYRLNSPTLGIRSTEGKPIPFMVPKGALIKVVRGPLDGTRLIDCRWDDTDVMLFTVDIRDRGTLVVRRGITD